MTKNGTLLLCEDLHVAVEGKQIVNGVSFAIGRGEKVALMGPNGSGKSSLANAIMATRATRSRQAACSWKARRSPACRPTRRRAGGSSWPFSTRWPSRASRSRTSFERPSTPVAARMFPSGSSASS